MNAVADFEYDPNKSVMTMESWNLKVDIECNLPGPTLSTQERGLLNELVEHAKQVALMLFENHDPDGYELWREQHPSADVVTWGQEPEPLEDDEAPDAKILAFPPLTEENVR